MRKISYRDFFLLFSQRIEIFQLCSRFFLFVLSKDSLGHLRVISRDPVYDLRILSVHDYSGCRDDFRIGRSQQVQRFGKHCWYQDTQTPILEDPTDPSETVIWTWNRCRNAPCWGWDDDNIGRKIMELIEFRKKEGNILGVCVLLPLENLLWDKVRDYTISRVTEMHQRELNKRFTFDSVTQD